MDEIPHLPWHRCQLRLLYSNHSDFWGSVYSKSRGALGGDRLLPTMRQEHIHDVYPRHIQCRERLLSLDITNTSRLAAANASEKEDRSLCNIHDRTAVSLVRFEVTPSISANLRFSACIASVLGLYYRVVLARKGDFAWKEVQVGSLV